MLKALELSGFKSFADKTRFEFPPGITVVVGPNGSGKSNIVDAIKWVLGETSAKSLRGKEMADVIFKGSGGASSARRPANAAEVTICFDNQDGLLPIDAPEVRVTRRVYRSGESEYLTNGNPCRLRDVKDIFRGTGMGADAYSLIEQGKVDTLLQASPRDRRAIFEEAAGISRFKAKKVETQRRLERVEQNLARLADIVEEVDSRLRTIRNQASKARRFKEYNDRLKDLRTQVSLADWRRFTSELADLQQQLDATRDAAEQSQATVSDNEKALSEIEEQSHVLEQQLRTLESSATEVRQSLAGFASTMHHEHQRLDDLAHEFVRYRRQRQAMTARAGDLGQQLQQIQIELLAAQTSDQEIRTRLEQQQRLVELTYADLQARLQFRDQQRHEQSRLQRQMADFTGEISMLENETQSLQRQSDRVVAQLQTLFEQADRCDQERLERQTAEAALQQQEEVARDDLNRARRALQTSQRELQDHQQWIVDLQRRLTMAAERARVLEELDRRQEGLSPGVQDLLHQSQQDAMGPLTTVRGMVADLIRVDVEMAPLLDAALDDLTQYLVVDGPALGEEIARGLLVLKGRVGVLDTSQWPETTDAGFEGDPAWASDRTVLGRADRFVETAPRFVPLVHHLLGRTWCVESLSDALRLRALDSTGAQFVTRAGELITADGRLLAGPRSASLGLVSRRSELRSLQRDLAELRPQLERAEQRVDQLKQQIASAQEELDRRTHGYDEVSGKLMDARLALRAAEDRWQALSSQQQSTQEEQERLQARREELGLRLHTVRDEREAIETQLADLDRQLESQQTLIRELEEQRQEQLSRQTEIRVELAKSEQRLDSLSGQRLRFEEDQRERERAIADLRAQLEALRLRQDATQLTVLRTSAQTAELALQNERFQSELNELHQLRKQRVQIRRQCLQRCEAARRERTKLEETRHQLELSYNELRHARESLCQRVREDYGIELSEVADLPGTEEERRQRAEVDEEINELRRRLSNMGAVNLAALDEIEALEERHGALSSQYQDLVSAKDALARIIHKINADSRRLFTESLETIRANFQALFRRVFGGGHADIVLEEGVDILEAGIDIMATPPGKHSLGISLLSGGERALTAVTLLLAIFQYRPSPFCVLDEVDGPLDEANIGRFVDILREFLQWTKFVVVTHSKKTMTAANTLYGVTMQESGVSKRVSVQFEDVSEDGHIRAEALHGSDDDDEQAA